MSDPRPSLPTRSVPSSTSEVGFRAFDVPVRTTADQPIPARGVEVSVEVPSPSVRRPPPRSASPPQRHAQFSGSKQGVPAQEQQVSLPVSKRPRDSVWCVRWNHDDNVGTTQHSPDGGTGQLVGEGR